MCQGLLEGYLLSGRHGVFTCYEAFIHIVDSMFNQHAKWLEAAVARAVAAADRQPQLPAVVARLAPGPQRLHPPGPGFLDVVMNKKPEIVRVYLPPDANTLLSTSTTACARASTSTSWSRASSRRSTGSSAEEAALHCARGSGIWEWAGTEPAAGEPDVVLACAGDVPTLETLAAASILRERAARPARAGGQRRRPHAAAARRASTRTGCRTASSTRSSRRTGRWSSPSTATRG